MGLISSMFAGSTKEISPICDVDLERYLGTWYELARFPHSFEKGLDNVTATYNLRSDGKIDVINSGLKGGERKVANGIAWIPDQKCTGQLLVSFFWLIKSPYKIIRLDAKDYSYAVVTSSTKSYLWFLSRKSAVSDELYNDFVSFADAQGFDVTKIIKVKHDSVY